MATDKKQPEKERQPLSPQQKRQARRRRARRRAIVRAVVLLLFCAALVLVVYNWDSLSPDRLMGAAENLLGIGTGSFPVDMSGVGVKHLAQVEDYSVVLTDSHLMYLNYTGAEVNRFPCAYPTALMRTAGRYVLVAEQGGRRLHLSTRSKVVLEMTADQDIITVAVSPQGQMAVLTQGPQGYAVQLKVYNNSGRLLYTRNRNQTVTEVALSRDSKQVAMLSVEANNGSLNTTLDVFSLETSAAEALCSYTAKDSLLYRAEYLNGNRVAAFGEDGVVLVNTADGLASVYRPDGMELLGYATADDCLALALRPYGATGDGQLHLVDTEGEPMLTEEFHGEFRHLAGRDGAAVLLTDSAVQRFSADGVGEPMTVDADGRQVALNRNEAVVLGLNRITAHTLYEE